MVTSLYLDLQSVARGLRGMKKRIEALEQRVSDLEDNQPPKDKIVGEMIVTRDNISDAVAFSNGWFGRAELLGYLAKSEERDNVCKIAQIVPMEWRVSY